MVRNCPLLTMTCKLLTVVRVDLIFKCIPYFLKTLVDKVKLSQNEWYDLTNWTTPQPKLVALHIYLTPITWQVTTQGRDCQRCWFWMIKNTLFNFNPESFKFRYNFIECATKKPWSDQKETGIAIRVFFCWNYNNWNHIKSNIVQNLVHKFIIKLIISVDNTSVVPSKSFVNTRIWKVARGWRKAEHFNGTEMNYFQALLL